MPEFYRCLQFKKGHFTEIDDEIVRENRFRIFFNDQLVTEMIATNDQLRELGAGYVVSEGITRQVDAVKVAQDRIEVYSDTRDEIPDRREFCPSGGIGIPHEPIIVISTLTISAENIGKITREIDNDIWKKTGAVHCAVLFSDTQFVIASTDVGMHNAIDKVIGHTVLNGIETSHCVIGCTGRQPAAIVKKSANAGIPIVISRTAATDKGIATANASGITLVCFSRDDRFTIYTHPERVRGTGKPLTEND